MECRILLHIVFKIWGSHIFANLKEPQFWTIQKQSSKFNCPKLNLIVNTFIESITTKKILIEEEKQTFQFIFIDLKIHNPVLHFKL